MSTTPTSCDGQARGRKKTNPGLRTAPAPMRDLPTNRLLPGRRAAATSQIRQADILAARRPGAIMDKSGPPRLITRIFH